MSDKMQTTVAVPQPEVGVFVDEIASDGQLYERRLSRLLMVFVITGLLFMLVPGTLLGVWNLITISSRQAAESVSFEWIQAHGHAQVFGWIGSFILGIGFHSIPKMRRSGRVPLPLGWVAWALWTSGLVLRWVANIYLWHWRWLLPVSAGLELAAFLVLFRAVSGHRARGRLEAWVLVVIAATTGMLLALLLNLGGSIYVALHGVSPAFPHGFDQRYLALIAWGFLVPFVWGFSARWMPIFLGRRPAQGRLLLAALGANTAGVLLALSGALRPATLLMLLGAALAPFAIRLLERAQQAPKTSGVHPSFPLFVTAAYAWLVVAAGLGSWAARVPMAAGIWGASRHALTVGFITTMVLSVGPRVLPAFSGMRLLFSTKLMFVALALVNTGCLLRVTSEVLAYQGYAAWAWGWLPVSALLELSGLIAFAANLGLTFASQPAHQLKLS